MKNAVFALVPVPLPTWRADYFDNPRDEAPSRSEIIVAENESDALHNARSKMGSVCSRRGDSRRSYPQG